MKECYWLIEKNITKQVFLGKKKHLNAVSRLECPLLVCKYKIRSLPNKKDLNLTPN